MGFKGELCFDTSCVARHMNMYKHCHRWRHEVIARVRLDKISTHAHGVPYDRRGLVSGLINPADFRGLLSLLAPKARTIVSDCIVGRGDHCLLWMYLLACLHVTIYSFLILGSSLSLFFFFFNPCDYVISFYHED